MAVREVPEEEDPAVPEWAVRAGDPKQAAFAREVFPWAAWATGPHRLLRPMAAWAARPAEAAAAACCR